MPLSKEIAFSAPLKSVVLERSGKAPPGPSAQELEEQRTAEFQSKMAAAVAQAKAKGKAEGLAELERAMAKERQKFQAKVGGVLQQLDTTRKELAEELNALLPELIIEGVGRILEAWEPDGATVESVVKELLAGTDLEDEWLHLRLHPTSIQNLKSHCGPLEEVFPEVRFVADERLGQGECLLEGRFGVVDARYSAKLSNLREVLE